jgi:hypothetical protein
VHFDDDELRRRENRGCRCATSKENDDPLREKLKMKKHREPLAEPLASSAYGGRLKGFCT